MTRNFLIAILSVTVLSLVISSTSCKKKGGFNIFTIQDDINFGAQMEAEIAANPQQFPILNPVQYANAYNYLETIKQQILASGKIKYANEFAWKLYIIQDDNTLNAFCTPGGYIYVYTGLIKYLENASSLAGVIGHEMAHADLRHSTQQLTTQYGVSVLLDLVLGKNEALIGQIAANLGLLAYSREHEKAADASSVEYLCPTNYRANGAADFFQKLNNESGQNVPAFLSTHPNPDNRVQNIQAITAELGCSGAPEPQIEINGYNAFKASLP